MKKNLPITGKIFFFFSILLSSLLNAQIVSPDAYIKGTSVEIGIAGSGGFEGANTSVSAPPAGMHFRSNTQYFGFVSNPQVNAWATFDGDFFTPGTPENGWGFEIGTASAAFGNNNCAGGTNPIPGSITSWTHTFNCYSSDWEGNATSGTDLHWKINYFLQQTDLYYTTTVSVTNNTGATIPEMYYYRNLDPDNNVYINGGDYSTQNTIVAQPGSSSCNTAHVKATSTNPAAQPMSYLGLAGVGANWRAFYGGFSNRDASDMWNAVGFTQTVGSTMFVDGAIGLAYKITNLAPGATETFKFVVILDDLAAGNAINNSLYLSYPGSATAPPAVCTPYTDTVKICAGAPATIGVSGPTVGSYNWSWSPSTGLSSSTGASVSANPASTTSYTLTGTPTVACYTAVSLPFIVKVSPAVTVTVPPNGSYCPGNIVPATAFTSTPAGATYTWTNSNPAIGLAASGSGNVPSFTAANGTGSAITATITVTPTGAAGGCTGTPNTYTITVTPPPTITVNSPTICPSQTATLTAAGGTTYSWSNGASGNPITVSPAVTTSYTVTGTTGGCSGTAVATVTIGGSISVTVNSPTICAGATANLTATGGTSYTWSAGATAGAVGSATAAPASTTSYTVTGTNGGCSGTAVSTVTVTPLPVVTVNSPTICNGATAALTAGGATSYTWSTGATSTGVNTANATPTTTTSYTVTGTTSGCSSTAVSTVTVTPLPVVTVNSPTICNGATAALTAGGATSYTWSAGATSTGVNTANATPATTTSFTVTGTTSGCSSTAVSTVTVNPIPVTTVNSPSVCPGVTASLTAGGATSYTWSAGATSTGVNTADATPASTTSYTVTGTSLGCSSTAVSTVTVTPLPVVTVNSPTICNGATAALTAGGATSYVWSAGATSTGVNTADATPASTTSYTVTGTTSGCSNTAVSTVTVNPIPVTTVNSPSVCPGVTASLTAGGATSYTWSAGATSTGVNTADATPASTTSYTVTGTSLGCSSTAVSTVTVAASMAITVNSPTICAGQTASLTAGGAASYAWSVGATSTGVNTADATPAATTTYTVTGTTGSCTGTAVSTVTVTPLPVTTATNATICNGATASISGGGATSYVWSAGATSTGVNTADATPSTTTSYTVTGTSSGCSSTAVSTVTVNPIPVVTVNSPSVCPGFTANLTASGATSYTWSAGATSTGVNTADATPAITTTYTVTGTSLGCSGTAISTVTVNSSLTVDAGLPDSICYSGSSTLNVTPNGAGFTYIWSPAASLSSASVSNPTASPAVTTTYTVTVTSSAGCTGTDSVIIYADPQISLALAGLPANCFGSADGQTIVIPSGGSGTFVYNWAPSGCTTAACNVAAGTYTVTATDSWGCTATGTSTVTQPTAVTATTTQVNVTCFGLSNGSATANPAGGTPAAGGSYNYSWNSTPIQNTQTATGLPAGTYTCTVTDAHGCSPAAPVVVTITQPPALVITPMSNITICNSSSTPITANVNGGTGTYSYGWTPAGSLSAPAAVNPTATPASTTTYTVNVTDANSCSSTSSVTVIVNPPLSVVTAGTGAVCPGTSAVITATASNGDGVPYQYLWSPATGLNNDTLAAPTATPAVTTTYTVTANDGCSPAVTATVTVTVLPLPAPVITSNITSGCVPVCVNFTNASTISSGTITGWNWNFGDGTDSTTQNTSHCFVTAGSYTITLTDTSAQGCVATTVIPYIITANPIPQPAFTAPASTSIFTPTVQYTDQSTISSGSIVAWAWEFGDVFTTPADDSSFVQNPSHTFAETGTFCAELTVMSNAGCKDSIPMCIVIDPEFTFFIPNAFSPNDDGINDEFYGKGEFIKKYEMSIYDRWGNLIFHADDINKHWNGKASNGAEIAQEDVYVYVIKLSDLHDKPHKYIGSVTIVK